MAAPDRGPSPDKDEEPRRFFIETWGCQMNVYDSTRISGLLTRMGLRSTTTAEEADVILLNTCSVREKAEHKMFSHLGRLAPLRQQRPDLLVGVAGCVAQQEEERILKRSPNVDFVVGTGAVGAIPELIARAAAGERAVDVSMDRREYDEVRPIAAIDQRRAYITVVEGCNKACSFCIVPTTRGPERNRPVETILDEGRAAIDAGAVELQLLGQNVNAYRHGEVDFAALLRMVDRLPGLRRLRFTTSHPREFTDGVIDAMASCERVCNHLHLPVQSGSNSVLKRMYRGYDRSAYLLRIERLRRRIPNVAVSTDIIVGFPGETAQEFEDTMSLLDEVGFDQVFAFVYSPRPGTRAVEFADGVDEETKRERLNRLLSHQDQFTKAHNAATVGRTVEVLVDGASAKDPGWISGRTTDNRIVHFPSTASAPLQSVRIQRALPHSLIGECAV